MDNAAGKDVVKRRILFLLKLLYEQTDEDHPLNTHELIEILEANGVPANRKTLKSDIDNLTEAGFDIVTVSSKPNRYFWGDRGVEMPELKLLIDAVSSSRFISQRKSRDICRKLTAMASVHGQKELDRHIYVTNRVKATNEQVLYIVDTVNDAIRRRRKISFQYTEYDVKKNKVLRNNGEVYELSPYALFWNDDFYYVVGYSDKHENVSAFRVDRLYKPQVLKDKAVKRPTGFSLDDYSRQIYEMYDGERVTVELLCRGDLMKYVIDRYGEDVRTMPVAGVRSTRGAQAAGGGDAPEQFIATVDVALSPNFYAWVFRWGGGVRIIAPEEAVEAFREMLQSNGL